MAKRYSLVLLFLVLLISVIFTINTYSNQSGQDVSNYIKYAPTMKDLKNDKTVVLKDYMDKVMVIEFFETWCPSCQRAIPELNEFYKKLDSDPNLKSKVVFFSILSKSSGSEKSIREFINQKNIKYPILLDESGRLAYNMSVRYIPTIFIVKDGKVAYSNIGVESVSKLLSEVNKVVK